MLRLLFVLVPGIVTLDFTPASAAPVACEAMAAVDLTGLADAPTRITSASVVTAEGDMP